MQEHIPFRSDRFTRFILRKLSLTYVVATIRSTFTHDPFFNRQRMNESYYLTK